MLQKIERLIKKKRHDKKGQAIIELALGTVLVSGLMMAIFDFALIIQSKTETMMMARNGVRYLIMQGIDVHNSVHNQDLARKTEATIRGLYDLNHGTRLARKYVYMTQGDVVVENTPNPQPIMTRSTGKNPVHAKVCENVKTLSSTFSGKSVKVCSEYAGYHSGQFKK